MTDLRVLTALERLAEPRGPKILVVGVPGAGKTSLLKTVSRDALSSVLFIDGEAGDSALGDLPVDAIRPRKWPDLRDIGAAIGGPNPNLPSSAPYSEAHYRAVMANPVLAGIAKYTILFGDSLTEFLRQCRVWAEQQPESFNARGQKDSRGTYGLVAREGVAWLQQIQHARKCTIILTAILEKITDDFGVSSWQTQLEGRRTGLELPGIIDEVIYLHFVDFGNGKLVRALICNSPNQWGLPAKDRSGKLDQVEEPHLGKLIAKLSTQAATTGESHA